MDECFDPFYPKPILILKPNLDDSQLYQINERSQSKPNLKHFSNRELDIAVSKAKDEIKKELSQKEWNCFIENLQHCSDKDDSDNDSDSQDSGEEISIISPKSPKKIVKKETPVRITSNRLEENKTQKPLNQSHDGNVNAKINERLNGSLNQIGQTFENIFSAISVNERNYLPTNPLEEEKVNRRTKEFVTRFGRSLYQTKQQYLSLRTKVTKLHLSKGQNFDSVNNEYLNKLVQVFRCCLQLLQAYLHHIPLSGGSYFPPIINDALETFLDVGNLATDLCVSTQNLAQNIRRLETLFCKSVENHTAIAPNLSTSNTGNGGTNSGNMKIMDNLAKDLFGPASPKKTLVRNKNKVVSGTPKPRGTKLLQARTNIARMKRMEHAAKEQSQEVSHLGHKNSAMSQARQLVNNALESTRYQKDLKEQQSQHNESKSVSYQEVAISPKAKEADLKRIMRRLHNLELLSLNQPTAPEPASPVDYQRPIVTPEDTTEMEKMEPKNEEKYLSFGARNMECLELAKKRLDDIQVDFDAIASKYGFDEKGGKGNVFQNNQQTKIDKKNYEAKSIEISTDKSSSNKGVISEKIGLEQRELMTTVCDALVRDLAAQVSLEMIQPEFLSQFQKLNKKL